MSKNVAKRTIAIDVDEVLASFAESFVDFSNQRWGTRLKPEDWDENWGELWGVTDNETDLRAKDVYKSNVFTRAKHINQAGPVLDELGKTYKLVVVTSRHRAVSKDTFDWIEKHFGGLFSEVHFAGIWDDLEKTINERLNLTKTEVCRQIGAHYLIDDNPKHCIAAAKAGIESIMFGDYRWNRDVALIPNMSRARNWQEVLEYFSEKS